MPVDCEVARLPVASAAMNTPITLESVRAGLAQLDDLTAFANKHRIPLRTLMRLKASATTGARQKSLDKVGKALKKAGITLDATA